LGLFVVVTSPFGAIKNYCMDYLKIVEFLVKEVAEKDGKLKALNGVEAKLNTKIIENDHWKEEALDYRNKLEPKWWDDEGKLKDEILHYKVKADGFEAKMIEYRSSYLSESDEVHDKEVEIGRLNTKINSLMKEYKDIESFYEAKVAKLQIDINHFKNNK
jgi:uncharacterized coiled-coil DUF342 family protein